MADFDPNAPATKGDIVALEERLTEAFRDGQTEMLKAFYGFMETVQARFKAGDYTEADLKKRIGVLEERILEIEKRLNLPPAA